MRATRCALLEDTIKKISFSEMATEEHLDLLPGIVGRVGIVTGLHLIDGLGAPVAQRFDE